MMIEMMITTLLLLLSIIITSTDNNSYNDKYDNGSVNNINTNKDDNYSYQYS